MPVPQVARYSQALRRLLAIKDAFDTNVLDDFFPTLDLFSRAPELFRDRQEDLWGIAASQAGAFGTSPFLDIGLDIARIPARTMMTVVTSLLVSLVSGAGTQILGVDLVAQPIGSPAPGNGQVGDGRAPFPAVAWPRALTQMNGGQSVFQGGSYARIQAVFQGLPVVNIPINVVLLPGQVLRVGTDATGIASILSVSATGYERHLEPSDQF